MLIGGSATNTTVCSSGRTATAFCTYTVLYDESLILDLSESNERPVYYVLYERNN
jgi:hypothetical protein